MIGAVESAEHGLRTRGGALTFEVQLLEHFESGLDLREVALRVGHFLLDALPLEFAAFDFGLGSIQSRLGRMKRFGGRSDLSRCFFKASPPCGLRLENLTRFVLERFDAGLGCLTACFKSR